MPKIIVQANQSDGDSGRVTLSERVVATHLHDEHYAAQLIERLTWATTDAERLETPTDDDTADAHDPAPRPTRSRADRPPSPRTRALASERRR
jgi:hypothetical protein